MRILIINEFVQLGGAEQIANNQLKLFKSKGYDVRMLCFNYGKADIKKLDKNLIEVIPCKSIINKFIFNINLYIKIRKWICSYNPDKIIVHSLWSSPLTCYPALKGYKSIQLIHDYYPICPTSLCVVTGENDRICTGGYKKEFCLKKCTENGSKLQLFIKYIYMKLYEFIRKRYIDLFISPSQTLCNYLEEYKYNTICINNPLANIEKLSEEIKLKNSIKKYIYAGGINHQKGIIEFLNVFVRFSKNKDVCMEVYGDITDNNIKNDFYKLINQENSKIKYYGHVDNNIIRNALKQSDYMIMPSKWMENYPTSVLEAMASGTVVIGSNRGGIPEMLSNNCGLIYEYGNDEDLLDILTKSLHLKDIEYRKIRDNAYNKVNEYNTYEVYYDKIKKILKTNIL